MVEFFAHLYEWFGLIALYSKDMGLFLRGMDFACTGYFAVSWYVYIGILMLIITVFVYALQNDLIDVFRFNKWQHWWLAAVSIAIANFIIAFAIPYITFKTGGYCSQLKLTAYDCIGFGISNAVWSLVLFAILTAILPFARLIKNRGGVNTAS